MWWWSIAKWTAARAESVEQGRSNLPIAEVYPFWWCGGGGGLYGMSFHARHKFLGGYILNRAKKAHIAGRHAARSGENAVGDVWAITSRKITDLNCTLFELYVDIYVLYGNLCLGWMYKKVQRRQRRRSAGRICFHIASGHAPFSQPISASRRLRGRGSPVSASKKDISARKYLRDSLSRPKRMSPSSLAWRVVPRFLWALFGSGRWPWLIPQILHSIVDNFNSVWLQVPFLDWVSFGYSDPLSARSIPISHTIYSCSQNSWSQTQQTLEGRRTSPSQRAHKN